MASVSFYKSGGPPGGGVFVVMNAVTGQPCGIFQENRFMTDLRTGAPGGRSSTSRRRWSHRATNAGHAAGGIALKHFGKGDTIGFIGCGASSAASWPAPPRRRSRTYKGVCYAPDGEPRDFCRGDVRGARCAVHGDVVGGGGRAARRTSSTLKPLALPREGVEKSWLKPHATDHLLGLGPADEAGDPHRHPQGVEDAENVSGPPSTDGPRSAPRPLPVGDRRHLDHRSADVSPRSAFALASRSFFPGP